MNYDEMPAGADMNALVEERVMGRTVAYRSLQPNGSWEFDDTAGCTRFDDVPDYCGEMGDAWLVHLNMCDRPFSVRRRYFQAIQEQAPAPGGGLFAWPDVLVVLRRVMPLTICRAAVKALAAR